MSIKLNDRFRGCLLGLAIGDALGARFEAQSADFIRDRIPTVDHLFQYATGELWYTDDTQMTIGVAETLVACGEIDTRRLCESFAENYVPSRGYGRGARAVIEAMEDGGDFQAVASRYFPGGSYGNGAAMRVAPVGLFFYDNLNVLLDQARLSALPTHVHPLGIEGAQLLALAVGQATKMDHFDRDAFLETLVAHCRSAEFRAKLNVAAKIQSVDQLRALGNGIEALESVVTAVASFLLTPNSYQQAIGNVILLGGDTDTLAAMTGAISGAFLGVDALPQSLIQKLEESPKGRSYIIELGDRLFTAHQVRTASEMES